MQTVKVLVVEPELDRQRPIRDACTIDPALQIVGYARTPGSGAAVAHAAAPDVIVYDPTDVEGPRVLDAIDQLRRAAPGAAVVLVPRHHPEVLPRLIRSLVRRR